MIPAPPPEAVYRIGRVPEPFAWPDWSYAELDGTFGNRFDDPQSTYRVLYAASERVGAYVETLAHFRPDPAVLAGLDAIAGDDDDDQPTPGVVPRAWFEPRTVGIGQLSGTYVDLGAAQTLRTLRDVLAARIVHYGLEDLDAAAIRSSTPRRFTQEISRTVYETTTDDGQQAWDGIAYLSRFGDDLRNWATFEPHRPTVISTEPVEPNDPAFVAALGILGLVLENGA